MIEYIVTTRSNNTTRQGSPYVLLHLSSENEEIVVSVWDVAPDMPPVPGQLVQFRSLKDYQGKKSCGLQDMIVGLMADKGHPLYGKLPRPIDRQTWDNTIQNLVAQCKDMQLVPIIIDFSEKLFRPYSEYPAATTVHHAFQGGLLNHTHQMLHMLEGLYPVLPYPIKIERCILAILFHDYGKVYEYNHSGDCQEDMYLLGHIYISAHKLQNVLEEHNIPMEEVKRIVHCVLAHHGQREYGSPVLPCTQEAAIVTYLDNISAKTDAMEMAPNGEYVNALGTHVIK